MARKKAPARKKAIIRATCGKCIAEAKRREIKAGDA